MKGEKITTDQCKDTGLAIILILMITIWITKNINFVLPVIFVLLLTMTAPRTLKHIAYLWFRLSHLLGAVVSKVLLTIIFILVATPVGLTRKVIGKDSMGLKNWKASKESAFEERNHTFTSKDLEKPF